MKYPCGIPEIDNARVTTIVGSDEVGYGSWAGPLLVVAVAAHCDWSPQDPELYNPKYGQPGENPYRDSKDLTKPERLRVYNRYMQPRDDLVISPCYIQADELDALGVGVAIRMAHRRAIEGTYFRLAHTPLVVVDGVLNPNLSSESRYDPKVYCLPKGDQIVPMITLASIIAKVMRDTEMVRLSKLYPGYAFDSNKGYRSAEHESGLASQGLSPIHRKSYEPMKSMLKTQDPPARPAWDIDD